MDLAALVATIALLALASWSLFFLQHLNLRRRMPPGPIGWPVLGSMREIPRLLSDPQKFQQLVARYGPIVTLWNGSVATILISSPDIAREALVEKGSVLASRPDVPSMRLLTSGFKTINSSPYGVHWRATRKNLVSGILSPRVMSGFAPVQEQAAEDLVRKLASEAKQSGGTVESLSVSVRCVLFQILSFVCFGRKLEEAKLEELNALMKEATTMLHPVLGDLVPFLKVFTSHTKQKSFLVRQNQLLKGLLSRECPAASESYVQTLLSLQGKNLEDVDLDLAVLVRELFIAGADTTTNCVEWSMANLIKYPGIQERVFRELAENVGQKSGVKVADLPKLPYLHAVVKEALRKHPPVYLSAPRTPVHATKLAGYDIPKESTVVVHLQSLSNDAGVWKNPDKFLPERFFEQTELSKRMSMIPFGAGRRDCPGKHLGMLHVHLIVANLVQAFEWRAEGKEVDLSPRTVFTVQMKNPLRASIFQLKLANSA